MSKKKNFDASEFTPIMPLEYGFSWGPFRIEKIARLKKSNGVSYFVLGVQMGDKLMTIVSTGRGKIVSVDTSINKVEFPSE